MAPPSSQSSAPSPSLKRKQATISSFFSQRPSATPRSTAASEAASVPRSVTRESSSLKGLATEQSHEAREQEAHGEEEVEEEEEEEEDIVVPPSKRARTGTLQQQQIEAGTPPRPKAQSSQVQPSSSQRTDIFKFQSSPAAVPPTTGDDDPDEVSRRQEKERLHQKFVRKLGGPDCLIGIGRSATGDPSNGSAEAEDEEEEDEPAPPVPTKGRGGTKKGAGKLTPMEKQVIEIKRKHMDTVLVIEVGYKFRFFGEDARIAAKELGIVCIPGKMRFDEHPSEAHLDRFASASIPVHRLHIHVKRLVTAGHKVGVVRQIETAALKAAGDNRNAPFVRKLTNLYTKGTYIDDAEGLDGAMAAAGGASPATGFMLCMMESNAKGWGNAERVHVGIVAVQPATGDVIYDDFEDGFMRSEIETRLLHIAPCEILIVGEMSKASEKLVRHLSGSKMNVFGDAVRLERTAKKKTAAAEAYSHVSNFYAGKMKDTGTEEDAKAVKLLQNVLELPEHVTVCLSAMIEHMTEYGLEHVFDLTKYFQPFSARSHMLLNGNTLVSLEIYQNQNDYSAKGSLFWTLDRTQTRFGHRLLRRWVGRPLLDKVRLEERTGAVEELTDPVRTVVVERIRRLLGKIKSDLEKSLIRIYYGKCTRPELLTVLQTMQTIAMEFADIKSPTDSGFKSPLISEAIASLPVILKDVVRFLDKINLHAARNDDKYSFFREEEETEEISDEKLGIASIEHELQEHLAVAGERIQRKGVKYATVAGIEYLIEVENNSLGIKKVPASWIKVSGTKRVSRFHTPEVVQLIRQRDQHKEALAAACDKAFAALLADIALQYQSFRDCVQSLATLDCLLSLAAIAQQPGYVKPEFSEQPCLHVEQGRHPMVERILTDSYVPNDTHLDQDETRAVLVTGPNMGGKSSYVRQVALIAIMGQIGSYVPAASAKLGLLDAVFTRMGAFDNMLAGESTFMVELSETADILKQATPRSLVILDELGRGTSTHDGVAIAQAVLDYMVRTIRSLTLFITHYQHLSGMARSFPGGELRNFHMRFTESSEQTDDDGITFLYEVAEGVAHRSYGLNVARLAHLPSTVLELAKAKSAELENTVKRKRLAALVQAVNKMVDLPGAADAGSGEVSIERLIASAEQL
ncbi:DNA mismatch repair protein msh3 [Penicillium diatomitis]|uniref:DNA mismatch repair protein MSH3 n=1 Tax=Penicillium diatomitis TaxID=2819901 RepID=A0A9X0BZQ0_9EURO|nr:DNA mismatch repair protein msh3 [Penicillium diatomitis]KAJ5491412.1 DNA mismatch repair protein msh3 [Penicillium diatomitis]